MANEYAVNQADLTAVADAIRRKTKARSELVFPDDFVSEIASIEGGGGGTVYIEATAYTSTDMFPSTAEEGTIAIISATPVSNVYVQNEEPATPETGDLWINTSYYSNVQIRTGNVTTYPISGKQYVGETWEHVNVYVRNNSEWLMLEVFLFKHGDLFESITGGWAEMWRSSDCAEITSTALVSTAGYQYRRAAFRTRNAVDLTPFKALKAVFTPPTRTYGSDYIIAVGINDAELAEGVHTNNTAPGLNEPQHCMISYEGVATKPTENFTIECDISGFSGKYYVTVYFHTIDSTCIEVQLLP